MTHLKKSRWTIFLVVFVLVVLAGSLTALAGLNARAREPIATPVVTATPVPNPSVQLSPAEGRPGTLVLVTGEDWRPGDTVMVRLDTPSRPNDPGSQVLVAFATVTDEGYLTAPFIFPSDAPWASLPYVLVTVWSPATGNEVVAELRVPAADPTPLPLPTATPTLTPTQPVATPGPVQPQPSPTPRCVDQASFVHDVTIPDNTYLSPGQSFVKTWRLRNSGTCTWTTDYALVFVDGHSMGAPVSVPLRGPVAPGSTVDLSVTLAAPASNGTYEGKWQLRNADGSHFGSGSNAAGVFWVRIVVGPTPTPVPAIIGWRGEYYANRHLTGGPVLTRDDAAISFDWGTAVPALGVPADGFSVRWTRTLSFEGGAYRFYARSDDGVRVWLDGERIIDEWHDATSATYTAERSLSAGSHTLHVEYYENGGSANVRFWWEKLTSYPDWRGEYWSNRDLRGDPALVRNDARVKFNWGRGAPAPGLPADNFAARWTRTASFDAATYRFHAVVDDGVRLWVDDQLILDAWHDGSVRELTVDRPLAQGTHRLRVEFYEHTADARVHVWWDKVSSPSYPDWKGEYWSNRSLKGSPALVRNDKAVDFQWGKGAAATGLPADSFSARWSRKVTLQAGAYRFHAWADDGVRFYLDGKLVLDEWHDSSGDEVYTVDLTLRGEHKLTVEYYERGGKAFARFWWKRLDDWPTPTPRPNRSPVAVDDSAITDEDTRAYVNVLANDRDPDGDALTVSDYQPSSARGGAVSCTNAGVCAYMPPADFSGSDSFSYTASDGKGGTGTGTVTMRVKPVNDPPVVADDAITTPEDTPVTANVLANDHDPDGDALTVSDYQPSSVQGGVVSCTSAGVCTYTPPAGFSGSDSFSYTASDSKGRTGTGTVSVTVNPVNDPPVAVDDAITTTQDMPVTVNVLANDRDPDGDALTVSDTVTASVQSGTVSCAADGVCTYTPPAGFNGTDTFTYTADDGHGGSDTGTVTVTVTPLDNPLLPVPTGARISEIRPIRTSLVTRRFRV